MYKNSTIQFNKEAVNGYIVSDYSSKDFKSIYDILSEFDNSFFGYYLCETNDKLERISLELYGSEKYWDLLLLINNRDPLFDMCYDYDFISSLHESNIFNLQISFKNGINTMSEELLEEISNKTFVELETENENLRTLLYVLPSKIEEFLRLLKDKGVL